MNIDFDLNYAPILVGAALYFMIGAVWYHDKVFGKPWKKEVGLKKKHLKEADMTVVMSGALIMMSLQAGLVAIIINSLGISGLVDGAATGLLLATLMGVPVVAVNYLFQLRTTRLFAIDIGYILVGNVVVGALLGIWQ